MMGPSAMNYMPQNQMMDFRQIAGLMSRVPGASPVPLMPMGRVPGSGPSTAVPMPGTAPVAPTAQSEDPLSKALRQIPMQQGLGTGLNSLFGGRIPQGISDILNGMRISVQSPRFNMQAGNPNAPMQNALLQMLMQQFQATNAR